MYRRSLLITVSVSALTLSLATLCQRASAAPPPPIIGPSLSISYQGALTTSPPLDSGLTFGWYNVMTVTTQDGSPIQGVMVTQTLMTTFQQTSNHTASPSGTWVTDNQGATDSNGQIKDLCQYQNKNAAKQVSDHAYKHATCTVGTTNLSVYFWNPSPYPVCTSSHNGLYDSVSF